MDKYGTVLSEIKGLPVRAGVARGKFLGVLPGGAICQVLDAQYYHAGRCNPKAGQWLKIKAGVLVGWVIGRYVQEGNL